MSQTDSQNTAIAHRRVINYSTATAAAPAISDSNNTSHNDLTYPPLIGSSEKNINSAFSPNSGNSLKEQSSAISLEQNKCCLCSNYKRQQCCLNLLYYKAYNLCYILIILIILASFAYDLLDLKIDNKTFREQPLWFVVLNMVCVLLMMLDILIHIQAFQSMFFQSKLNWVDFIMVLVMAAISPLFWFEPAWILQLLLLIRYSVRLLRRHTFRKEYVSARNVIVDFSKFEENVEEKRRWTTFDENNNV